MTVVLVMCLTSLPAESSICQRSAVICFFFLASTAPGVTPIKIKRKQLRPWTHLSKKLQRLVSAIAGKHEGTQSSGESIRITITVAQCCICAVTANIYIWYVKQMDGEKRENIKKDREKESDGTF